MFGRDMAWNRMNCKHYLLAPLGWHPPYLFCCGPAFIGESICVEKVPVWLLLSENFSHLSFCSKLQNSVWLQDLSARTVFTEALLLLRTGILPGLQDPKVPTWLKIPSRTELMATFRLWIHVICNATGSCDSLATVHWKILGLMEFLMERSCRMQ